MVAVRVLALTAVVVVAAGFAGDSRAPVLPGSAGGGHFAPLSLTSRAAPQARQSATMAYYPPGEEIVLLGGESPYRRLGVFVVSRAAGLCGKARALTGHRLIASMLGTSAGNCAGGGFTPWGPASPRPHFLMK
jgi:hypothetical protein